jgi:hypothetical protein
MPTIIMIFLFIIPPQNYLKMNNKLNNTFLILSQVLYEYSRYPCEGKEEGKFNLLVVLKYDKKNLLERPRFEKSF